VSCEEGGRGVSEVIEVEEEGEGGQVSWEAGGREGRGAWQIADLSSFLTTLCNA